MLWYIQCVKRNKEKSRKRGQSEKLLKYEHITEGLFHDDLPQIGLLSHVGRSNGQVGNGSM